MSEEVTKPIRKKKAAARWAMLEELSKDELKETMGEMAGTVELFRIVVDNCKSEKAARDAGESAKISGRVLLVCIHADGTATPKTQTTFNWKK